MKIITIKIEEALHQEFKGATSLNGQTIKDAMTELIKYYVKNEMIKKDEK